MRVVESEYKQWRNATSVLRRLARTRGLEISTFTHNDWGTSHHVLIFCRMPLFWGLTWKRYLADSVGFPTPDKFKIVAGVSQDDRALLEVVLTEYEAEIGAPVVMELR